MQSKEDQEKEQDTAIAAVSSLGEEITSPHPKKRRRTDPGGRSDVQVPTTNSIEKTTKTSERRVGAENDFRQGTQPTVGPWGFTQDEVDRFPALKRRNFWCIQRHSATAMHYDLRMQVDGGTVSWAVPKGLIGISKNGESSRMAVETTIHPISYTTYEGADGRHFSAGRKGGTLLWDIGQYAITRPYEDDFSSSEEQAISRRKRRHRPQRRTDPNGGLHHLESESSDDPEGHHQEDLFRQALFRPLQYGKSRSIHFTLKGGRKMVDHPFILILAASSKTTSVSSVGKLKKTWFLRLPKGVDGYPWDRGGEEGDFWGRSVKSGRTLKEVCAGYIARPDRWKSEEERFKSWFGDADDV
ncbi:DNA ligase D, 3'-phosphoesterase domain-containing protein [Kwoniella heveanensis BCC8398]|uniref:DNA ligase D, 3'-phosphoesterase domain-containing protein n=1 Tax=Kwoniella heveanensis BCC8398 TaxID=1296120 RepID=A0A1B9GLZ1_9TREE|nr:DNA ligase D, 3'-phosphoesterase domain-containing protein [Kwoniella heveanensis BCC8398]